MKVTTDFQTARMGFDLECPAEIGSLHTAVETGSPFGIWNVQPAANGKPIVSADHSDLGLLLASDRAKDAFLRDLTQTYCGGLDMESWCSYMHAVGKDD
jgi:hypothetical protein